MPFDVPDLESLLRLEPIGDDQFTGYSPAYPWGGLYGGQVAAQSLRAASLTLDDDDRPVHSLHGYFIRQGDVDQPVRFEVDRIRDGRSFATRRVVAHQAGGAIFNLSASFQTPEHEASTSSILPPSDVPPPDDLEPSGWGEVLDRRIVRFTNDGNSIAWLRVRPPRGGGPVLAACALAYTSDDLPTSAVGSSHPVKVANEQEWDRTFFTVSLDHSIWFHRQFAADAWLLHHHQSHGVHGGRGLSIGTVFDENGHHVATITQEVLLRRRRRS